MATAEIAKLKKAFADMELRMSAIEESFENIKNRIDDACKQMDAKQSALVESMKTLSCVQSNVILEQIRNEIRMEYYKIQRDLQRDIRALR
jgi:predicted  nucleic acid-binding Zn-ribbon protein